MQSGRSLSDPPENQGGEAASAITLLLEVSPMRNLILPLLSVGMVAFVAACATEPSSQSQRQALVDSSQTTLKSMEAKDPGLQDVVNRAYAYVVFPDIGK